MNQPIECQNIFRTDLEELFSSEVSVCLYEISDYTQQLFPEEHELISTAVSKRRNEFSTGRLCARQALSQLGIKPQALLKGTKREPLWPEGIKGSISHSSECGIAVVSCDVDLISIGIDVELIEPISESVCDMICTQDEIDALGNRSHDPIAWKLMFSAKESIYKCLYPVVKKWIGFSDAQLQFDFSAGTFSIIMRNSLKIQKKYCDNMKGRFVFGDGYLFTFTEITR